MTINHGHFDIARLITIADGVDFADAADKRVMERGIRQAAGGQDHRVNVFDRTRLPGDRIVDVDGVLQHLPHAGKRCQHHVLEHETFKQAVPGWCRHVAANEFETGNKLNMAPLVGEVFRRRRRLGPPDRIDHNNTLANVWRCPRGRLVR